MMAGSGGRRPAVVVDGGAWLLASMPAVLSMESNLQVIRGSQAGSLGGASREEQAGSMLRCEERQERLLDERSRLVRCSQQKGYSGDE